MSLWYVPQRAAPAETGAPHRTASRLLHPRAQIAHSLGWWAKTLMLRDPWLCWAVSLLFEFCEISLAHYLPNFHECAFDHWGLDFFGCNAIGILAGQWTLSWLNSKEYNYLGISQIHTLGGKLQRGMAQFLPASWTQYRWHMFSDFRRFMFVVCIVLIVLMCELCAFFLKTLLWVPSTSMLNVYRIALFWLIGCAGFRDAYHFMSDSSVRRVGTAAWIGFAMVALETLLVLKLGKGELWHIPWPRHIATTWAVVGGILCALTAFWFLVALPRRRAAEAAAAKQADSDKAKAE